MKQKKISRILVLVIAPLLLKAQNKQVAWTNTDFIHGMGYSGTGMFVNIFDNGGILQTHQEFGARVQDWNGLGVTGAPEYHATAVTSVAISKGVNALAKGTAFGANARVYSSTEDIATLRVMQSPSFPLVERLISNHSYEYNITPLTMNQRAALFGAYTQESADVDHLCFNNPYWLPVTAAGNNGLATNPSPISNNYDKLTGGHSTTKNMLVVGNINSASFMGGGLLTATLNPTSSYGPTDDLRIKPDVCAPGTDIVVAGNPNINLFTPSSYSLNSGTSFSAPAVAGIAALLQQYYFGEYKTYMRAATVKGLLMHTAEKLAADNRGQPDPYGGYGMVNAKSAITALINRGNTSVVDERWLYNGRVLHVPLRTGAGREVVASISWTDDQPTNAAALSNPFTSPANNVVPSLVNDLNISVLVTENNNSVYVLYPYRLAYGYNNTITTLIDGENHVDNYEQVRFIPKPNVKYEVIVNNTGTLVNNVQNYSLIITGLGDDPNQQQTCPAVRAIRIPIAAGTRISATQEIVLNANVEEYAGITALDAPNVELEDGANILNGDFFAGTDGCNVGPQLQSVTHLLAVTNTNIETNPAIFITDSTMDMYPNPVSNSVTIKNNKNSKIRYVQLFTSDGRLLQCKTYNDSTQVNFDLQRIAAGMYNIVVTSENGTITNKKLIKE